jgi:acyl-CoA thioesterase
MKSQATTESDDRLRAYGQQFWELDNASKNLGISLVSIERGRAILSMVVTDRMINSHNICHGALIFALADSAFAVACNTYRERSVGQHCTITYIIKAKLGDRLSAVAIEVNRSGKSGIYNVTISNDAGAVVAEFRGHSRVLASASPETKNS